MRALRARLERLRATVEKRGRGLLIARLRPGTDTYECTNGRARFQFTEEQIEQWRRQHPDGAFLVFRPRDLMPELKGGVR